MIEEAEVASVIEGGEVASAIEEAEGGEVALVIEVDEEALVIEAGAEDLVVEVKIVIVGLLNFYFDNHSYTFLSYGQICPIKYMAWIISYKTLLSFTISCSCHHSFSILFK